MLARISQSKAPRHGARPWAVVVLALVAAGCVQGPLEWRDEATYLPTVADGSMLAIGDDGRARIEPSPTPLRPVTDAGACVRSVRYARAGARELHAVWWRVRGDSSAALIAARSEDGGATWAPPVPVDTTDRGVSGCDRMAPSIIADAGTGYVHVAYHLRGAEGAGVFFSHSMERGALYHAPMVIVYGDRPAATSVASWGRTVVVAFENPNSARPRISIAVSRTDGHSFERERVDVSSENSAATRPLVAVRGDRVAVGWSESGRFAIRQGDLRAPATAP